VLCVIDGVCVLDVGGGGYDGIDCCSRGYVGVGDVAGAIGEGAVGGVASVVIVDVVICGDGVGVVGSCVVAFVLALLIALLLCVMLLLIVVG